MRSAGADPSPLYVGLMSGTSLDGLDVILVEYGGREERPAPARSLAFRTVPWPDELRARLRRLCEADAVPLQELAEVDAEIGDLSAAAVRKLLDAAGVPVGRVAAIGSHGQTVRHRPPGPGRPGFSLQIGDPARIAEGTGITVVADFRRRDVAAGGHGAPLSPLFDDLVLAAPERSRAVQNLGGMANLTALPPAGSGHQPVAFDTGPGVALLDAAVARLTGGEAAWDQEGRLAATGTVDEEALAEWLADPFFAEAPPRSTGRERFGTAAAHAWLGRHSRLTAEDAAATLTELTARTVAEARRFVPFSLDEMLLCGGGARNPELRRRIAAHLDPLPVRTLDVAGWDPDAREAAAFALLARQHLLGHPARLEWATGAPGARVLGVRVPA